MGSELAGSARSAITRASLKMIRDVKKQIAEKQGAPAEAAEAAE